MILKPNVSCLQQLFRQRPLPCIAAPRQIALCSHISDRSRTSQERMSTSQRVKDTDAPIIVKTQKLTASAEGVISLAQGIVHWSPPQQATNRVVAEAGNPKLNHYGSGAGMPELVTALRHKLATENGIHNCEVMVTAGANQAFTNVVLTLLDTNDSVVLFKPYYFNHLMAVQMTGGATNIMFGRCKPDSWHPDLDWLEECLQQENPPRMVVIVNPCNPTGVLLSKAELQRASDLCEQAGSWLIMDNTYEHFTYEGREHTCVSGSHVINIFSMSKAFGMMGWRLGYIAYPDAESAADPEVGFQMSKVQDTIPICVTQMSQVAGLGALEAGSAWVRQQVEGLADNRAATLDALSVLSVGKDSGVAGGEGAIYFWAKLPQGCEDDDAVVSWLVKEHKVCVVPGSACGCPGYIRVAFANLEGDKCKQAAAQLKKGLRQLVDQGPKALQGNAVETHPNNESVDQKGKAVQSSPV